ncbi:two-component system regulatory protein YycI [Oceanobacillus manasiensis]|uniref:two-component system regulatory protein YycI n=1 Tax=Oceanobacillus manasiensis TaxID=586413 RepID=UPI0005A911A4|nr:two-component system regulatory protein YycI [Oceanobacillus manasiensis]
MQWSQIKTLFILCFLILDIYLLVQFIDKQDRADQYSGDENLTLQEELKREGITLGDIKVGVEKESPITVSPIEFTEEQKETIDELDNQETVINTDNLIISHFDDPIPISEEADGAEISQAINDYVYRAENYKFWEWDKELNVILFFQEKEGDPIYYNQYGLLLVFLNEDNEIEYYTQSILGDTDASHEDNLRTLIKPMQAIGTLYEDNSLFFEDHVDDVEFGYHTWIPPTGGKQVFAPTYKVSVNEERDYFINAIEGQLFTDPEENFTRDMIMENFMDVQVIPNDLDWKDDMINKLRKLTQAETNRSELP